MKIWNLAVSQDDAGGKVVDLQIHGEIDGGWWSDDSVSTAEIAKALAEHPDAKKINTHINSIGGSLFGGVAVYNILQAHGAEVTSYVDGLAASAASIIAMAGKTVMGTGSMLMIHNPMAIAMGDAADMRKTAAMLDKARDSLLAVYKAKTGKDGTELKAMLDAETWMGAEQAVRQGFADEMAGDAGDPVVQDLGDQVVFNAATFARAKLPAQILAMARPKTPPTPGNSTPPTPAKEELEMEITREVLAAKAPELLKMLLAEGEKAGADKERARLQEIDDLKLPGCEEMVHAAKYGEKQTDARELTYAIAKAGALAATEMLEARRRESEQAAKVQPTNPAKNEEQAAVENMKAIAKAMAARREGRI